MRLGVYTDYVYRRDEGAIYAERAFALFLAELRDHVDRLTLIGRLDPDPGHSHYRLPPGIELVGLPHYRSLVRLRESGPAMARALRRFWRALDGIDVAWLLGPYPIAIAFAAMALVRGRRVVLGVRQDTPRYIRSRHPDRRLVHLAADLVDWAYRALGRRLPVVVVGPELGRRYARSARLLEISVSLVREADIVTPRSAAARPYDGELRVLSVGRLEREKNPLLLADVLAALCEHDPRWRLVVCGEGPMEADLAARLRELGVADHADLRGYLPIWGGLMDLYRESHALLHVSFTEGLPQVLFEAFAAGLPVVATAVGGIPAAVDGAALLVPPDDRDAAVAELLRIAGDEDLRARLVEAGAALVRERTTEAETRRVAEFLRGEIC